jgi:hypothetical protein
MRYSKLPSKSLLAALLMGAVVLTMPVVASAAPATPLQSAHVARAESVQTVRYYRHHWYSHRWYAHHHREYWHYG